MTRYSVVGCRNCSMLWIIDGQPVTSKCPRCSTRYQTDRLRTLAEANDKTQAKELRAQLLADEQDQADGYDQLDSYSEMDDQIDDVGVTDEEYLSSFGVDPDAAQAAASDSSTATKSNREIVLDAIDTLNSPTETDIIEYASDRGVSPDYVNKALPKLVETGDVSKHRGTYRLI
ncbi:replication protein H [Salinarchaeum sp. IM2453]|uniref:DUF5817 domain-containing protein n=1 Tax=Salinarchaeum sp. IM2453 TaxID=2862870 RepID=UPI001C83D8FD|nr:DUF5817 domain-containing protein [Salinarchaeum sp. IM2453]QZA89478.1 replication protein H [Salinarchaeum sp. IM2453]